jgi:hypothetical protein
MRNHDMQHQQPNSQATQPDSYTGANERSAPVFSAPLCASTYLGKFRCVKYNMKYNMLITDFKDDSRSLLNMQSVVLQMLP